MGIETVASGENAGAKPIWQAPVIEVFDVAEAESAANPGGEPGGISS